MKRVLYRVSTYLVATFVVVAVLEYGGFLSPVPSRFLDVNHLFLVTLVLSVWSLRVYVSDGPPSRRERRWTTLCLVFVSGLVVALLSSLVAMGRDASIGTNVLIYVYATAGALGGLVAVSAERQTSERTAVGEERSRIVDDPPFFVALLLFVGALFAYHPDGLDEQVLGVLLFFTSSIYYSLASVIERLRSPDPR